MQFGKYVAAAVVVCGLGSPAFAIPVTGQISIGGYGTAGTSTDGTYGTATSIDFATGASFDTSGSSGGIYLYGGASGSFAGLGNCASAIGACGTIQDVSSTSSSITDFLSLNNGALTFDLSSITAWYHPSSTTLTFNAAGLIHLAGYDATQGIFTLTTQGNKIVSFSATTLAPSPVPVPATGLLLLSGLGALGVARKRRKAKAA